MLSFDPIQIITALNDNQFMIQLINKLNVQLEKYNKLPNDIKDNQSLWQSYLRSFGKNASEHNLHFQVFQKELDNFPTPEKKKQYMLSILRSKLRSIDYLRTQRILNILSRYDDLQLLATYCTNNGLFVLEIHKIQNQIQKHISQICNAQIQARQQKQRCRFELNTLFLCLNADT